MLLLILGILLWSFGHLFKRLAPAARDGMGEAGKGLVAVAIGAGLVLMILGYRWAPVEPVWTPPALMTHINNLLMLAAMFLFFVGGARGRIAQKFRHPQLTAVKTWAVAHLIVNGDVASILLFGSMLLWAVAEVVLINRSGPFVPPAVVRKNGDIIAAVIGAVAYAVIAAVHVWLGYYPFG
ncbi:MAG: hypothetical protein KDA73_19125 [Rhodobacteraceae bacterium]|nr:hypothetical protein [Paracoccaceae bacterium]